jgi:hypothetical protein
VRHRPGLGYAPPCRRALPHGTITSGARIQRCDDLVKEGLAWRPGVEHDPKLVTLEKEIKDAFRRL